MSISLRADGGGNSGAIQVGGVDKLLIDNSGLDSGLSIGGSVAGNALTITLNPCTLRFRSATLGSGTVNNRQVASQISLVVSSGSTLGTVSAQPSRLAVIAIDNAGTVELAVANIAGGANLDETTLISTTAEGGAGAADSATAIYSATARASVPFRVVGYIESTQATAGTWATAPSTIQGAGGNALTSLQSLGHGQTWQDVTGSRAIATTYYNTTGKPIMINVTTGVSSGTGTTVATIGGVSVVGSSYSTTGVKSSITAIVPPGASYSVTNSGTGASLGAWTELR
jgi:hypothetical protein